MFTYSRLTLIRLKVFDIRVSNRIGRVALVSILKPECFLMEIIVRQLAVVRSDAMAKAFARVVAKLIFL
jgi:hypothetical protein